MADLDPIVRRVIPGGLALLPSRLDSVPARVMLLAIHLQEDPDQRRRQWPTGPARGLWQFEQGGGVRGVLNHAATRAMARAACAERGVDAVPATVWKALEHDDLLACAFARLLLWSDPSPLPKQGYGAAAFQLYLRTWRPGAWANGTTEQRQALRAKWDRGYAKATETIAAVPA